MTLRDAQTLLPPCRVCARPSAQVQLERRGGNWHLRYTGPGGSNGQGSPITYEQADRIVAALTPPYESRLIQSIGWYDDAGYCSKCSAFYCATHWNLSPSGGGFCPGGHFKSLDPHWSPN